MERDKKLEKIIRENSLMSPPAGFTESILDKIGTETIKSSFKPIIGKRTAYIALSFVAIFLLVAILGSTYENSEPLLNLPDWDISLSQWNINLPKFDFKIPSVVLASVLAVFFLVLTDAGFRRSRS